MSKRTKQLFGEIKELTKKYENLSIDTEIIEQPHIDAATIIIKVKMEDKVAYITYAKLIQMASKLIEVHGKCGMYVVRDGDLYLYDEHCCQPKKINEPVNAKVHIYEKYINAFNEITNEKNNN